MDLYDLKIIGWSYSENMTAELVTSAFKKAKEQRKINLNNTINYKTS